MNLGNVRGDIPIHGFLTTNDQWQVVEIKADKKSAWITCQAGIFQAAAMDETVSFCPHR